MVPLPLVSPPLHTVVVFDSRDFDRLSQCVAVIEVLVLVGLVLKGVPSQLVRHPLSQDGPLERTREGI